MVTPVALRPGRFRLETRPDLTGSDAVKNTIGMVLVAPFAIKVAASPLTVKMTATCSPNKIDHHPRQSLHLSFGPPNFDGDVLAVGEPHLCEAFTECSEPLVRGDLGRTDNVADISDDPPCRRL
jgi:hypothetical protein